MKIINIVIIHSKCNANLRGLCHTIFALLDKVHAKKASQKQDETTVFHIYTRCAEQHLYTHSLFFNFMSLILLFFFFAFGFGCKFVCELKRQILFPSSNFGATKKNGPSLNTSSQTPEIYEKIEDEEEEKNGSKANLYENAELCMIICGSCLLL